MGNYAGAKVAYRHILGIGVTVIFKLVEYAFRVKQSTRRRIGARRIRGIVPTQTCERIIKLVNDEQRTLYWHTSVYIMREIPRLRNT